MTNLAQFDPETVRWLDEAVMCTSLLHGGYRKDLEQVLARARDLIEAQADNANSFKLLRSAAQRMLTQADRQVTTLLPQAPDDRAALAHAHTCCARALAAVSSLHAS
jgi:hypothetical protein